MCRADPILHRLKRTVRRIGRGLGMVRELRDEAADAHQMPTNRSASRSSYRGSYGGSVAYRIPSQPLSRVLGTREAVLLGLGSILGTGVFVSLGIAAGVAGPGLILAIPIAAAVATCNGLSSAQLAASHPVSGGTYEYGYRYLTPALGFTAGWMFLCAKTASAATAALGLSGYIVNALGATDAIWRLPVALSCVGVLTMVILSGMRTSSRWNTVVVSTTLIALGLLVLVGLVRGAGGAVRMATIFPSGGGNGPGGAWGPIFHGTALMFVAFTGYGRIATLGEEVAEPKHTIPKAVILTLLAALGIYLAVGWIAIGTLGSARLARATAESAAPLEAVARGLASPGLTTAVAVGAIAAMAGVLLNLLLGLSRVALAMGRRGDLPGVFSRVDRQQTTPAPAVALTAVLVAGLVLLRDVRVTWSFSAFTVLIYYAITNLAALRLPANQRRYPRGIAVIGLLSCLFLAVWVDPVIFQAGLALLIVGFAWHLLRTRVSPPAENN